jgi:hypothetical protein
MEDKQLFTSTHLDDVETFEVCPGITGRRLAATDLVRGWYYEFAPGTRWPSVDHHEAEERYFVVSGEIIDNGERYPAGTYVVFAPGSSHQPASEIGGEMLGLSEARGT